MLLKYISTELMAVVTSDLDLNGIKKVYREPRSVNVMIYFSPLYPTGHRGPMTSVQSNFTTFGRLVDFL